MLWTLNRAQWGAWRQQAPVAIAVVAALYTLAGLSSWVCWRATSDATWVNTFFRYPSAILTIAICAAEFSCCLYAWRHFERGDSLYRAWFFLTLASGAHLFGRLLSQIVFRAATDAYNGEILQQAGIIIGGPLQMLFLLFGLSLVARTCIRSGLSARVGFRDVPLMILVGGVTAHTIYEIWLFVHEGKTVTWAIVLSWPSDPLLILLLLLAIAIRRSVGNMGRGMIASCWGSFVVAISFIAVGDAGLWLMRSPYIPGHLASLTWYVWFLADSAFAMGPAYQVAALDRARSFATLLSANYPVTAT